MIGVEKLRAYINNGSALPATLKVEQDVRRERTDLPRPNPHWEHTDSNGHYHAYADDKKDRYPTLEERIGHVDCDGSCGGVCQGEGYRHTRFFCRICRDEIEPGLLHGPYSFDVPGPMHWELDVEGVVAIGEKCSVRLEHGAQSTLFGIATAVQIERDHHPAADIWRVVTKLVGEGTLGQRPR